MSPETVAFVLSWASHLSGYPVPDVPVDVQYVPSSWFSETMCGGADCNVIGGFLDGDDPDTLYLDERLEPDEKSMYVLSFAVHEAAHLLQYYSGLYESDSCEDSLRRERQAYYLQNEFLVTNGNHPVIHLTHGRCAK